MGKRRRTTTSTTYQEAVVLRLPELLQVDQISNTGERVSEEEQTVACPDCFDTMIEIYYSDKMRYQCENCDLIIGKSSL